MGIKGLIAAKPISPILTISGAYCGLYRANLLRLIETILLKTETFRWVRHSRVPDYPASSFEVHSKPLRHLRRLRQAKPMLLIGSRTGRLIDDRRSVGDAPRLRCRKKTQHLTRLEPNLSFLRYYERGPL